MADNVRDKTGPLTDLQRDVLSLIAQGLTYERIAKLREINPGTLRHMIVGSILPKMGVGSRSQAVALWGRAEGLREAAVLLKNGVVEHPINEAEVHVNHVLLNLAELLEQQANDLIP